MHFCRLQYNYNSCMLQWWSNDTQPTLTLDCHVSFFSCVLQSHAVRQFQKQMESRRLTMRAAGEKCECRTTKALPIQKKFNYSRILIYLIAGLISVVDSFDRHHFWGEKVGKFAKVDTIPQTLLQFSGKRQFLLQAGLHPPKSTQTLSSKKQLLPPDHLNTFEGTI